MNDRTIRIGVIGVCGRGSLARFSHRPDKGSCIVAGADIREACLQKLKGRFGEDVFVTKDYRKLLARPEIDVVFVTTPDYLHEEQAVAALQAGKAVYLEKPMAISIEGCNRILRTAYETKSKLYLGHNMRHHDFVVKMKELIEAGKIGEVKTVWCRHFVAYGGDAYFKDWHAEIDKTTGLLLQKATHDIDVVHWLSNSYTKSVQAMGSLMVYNRINDRIRPGEDGGAKWRIENWPPLSQKGLNSKIEVEDVSIVNMRLENGVLAAYQQCHFTPDAWRNYTVIGTEGRMENFVDQNGNSTVKIWNRRTKHFDPNGDEQCFLPHQSGGHGGADPKIVAEFLDYVRTGCRVATSPVAARNSVATGCMATASLRNGLGTLEVPPCDPELVEYFDRESRMEFPTDIRDEPVEAIL